MSNDTSYIVLPKKRIKRTATNTSVQKSAPGKRDNKNNNLFALDNEDQDTRVANAISTPGADEQTYSDLPYLKKSFVEFMRYIGRVFYDDECIILLEFLATQERAYTESDIREETRWRDSLLHGKLLFLESQLILQRHQATDKGVRSPVYWRISQHVARAVKYHCDTYLESLQSEVSAKESRAEFCCPACGLDIDALDIMSGPRRVTDEHPICPVCPNEVLLITNNHDNERSQAKQQLHRAQTQLWPVYQRLQNIISINVPEFPPFTRADKNDVTAQAKALQSFQEREAKEQLSNNRSKPNLAVSKQAEVLKMGLTRDVKAKAPATSRLIPWFQTQRKGTTGQETTHDTITHDAASTVLSKKRSAVSFSFNRNKVDPSKAVPETVAATIQEETPTFDKLLGAHVEETVAKIKPNDIKIFLEKRNKEFTIAEIMEDPEMENDMNDAEYEKYIYLQEEQNTA